MKFWKIKTWMGDCLYLTAKSEQEALNRLMIRCFEDFELILSVTEIDYEEFHGALIEAGME